MVHKVDAGASILAGLVLALVHFILTVDTLIPWNTLSGEKDTEKWIAAGDEHRAEQGSGYRDSAFHPTKQLCIRPL